MDHTGYHILSDLEQNIRQITTHLPEFGAAFEPQLKLADPRFGDFQLNGVLPFAKSLSQPPYALAQSLTQALLAAPAIAHDFEISLTPPGFINFRLKHTVLNGWLNRFCTRQQLQQGAQHQLKGQKIVIDYSSPNTAKQMHVGHLRSMVIGEALQRILRFCGAQVVRDNHLGDWGTQFGILLMQIKEEGYDVNAPHEDPIDDLEKLYQRGSARFKESEAAQIKARQELVELQQAKGENFELWQAITRISYQSFDAIYRLFDVEFDQVQGESFYKDQLERVYQELLEAQIAQESQGAWVVFHPSHPRFKDMPFIIRKADGASNYASTDLATALHHVEQAHATRLIYVTDGRQQDHFQQLFLTVERWFQAKGYPLPIMEHPWFGTVLGEDGKAIKTRTGEPIKLKDLIQEAQARAYTVVTDKSPHLPEDQRQTIAQIVGISSLRYADLCQNRTSDYMFSWDKMLALEGNTGPYLLYAVARLHSIFRKINLIPESVQADRTVFETQQELALAKKLIQFPILLQAAQVDLKPHYLCLYLYELASSFSSFYAVDQVIGGEKPTQERRLLLCARTLLILETGLHLLGVQTLKSM